MDVYGAYLRGQGDRWEQMIAQASSVENEGIAESARARSICLRGSEGSSLTYLTILAVLFGYLAQVPCWCVRKKLVVRWDARREEEAGLKFYGPALQVEV